MTKKSTGKQEKERNKKLREQKENKKIKCQT